MWKTFFLDNSCFVCWQKALFSHKSSKYERNAAPIKVHIRCRYESIFTAQFSCDVAFWDRCSFLHKSIFKNQEKCPLLKTPITIDVPVIECDENQLMNPEIIR